MRLPIPPSRQSSSSAGRANGHHTSLVEVETPKNVEPHGLFRTASAKFTRILAQPCQVFKPRIEKPIKNMEAGPSALNVEGTRRDGGSPDTCLVQSLSFLCLERQVGTAECSAYVLRFLPPRLHGDKKQQAEDFQPSQEHGGAQYPFPRIRNLTEIGHGTHHPETGPHVPHGGRGP